MADKWVDYGKEMLGKFKKGEEVNQTLIDQLKTLPDHEIEIMADSYPSNIYVQAERKRREKEKKGD